VLLVYFPIHDIYEKRMQKKYYTLLKKHFENPLNINTNQLKDIFPGKKPKELDQIAAYLEANNS
jgi:hypothetical protein